MAVLYSLKPTVYFDAVQRATAGNRIVCSRNDSVIYFQFVSQTIS